MKSKLTIINYSHTISNKKYYIVKCECGTVKPMRYDVIKKYISCGCEAKKRLKLGPKACIKHAMADTKIYKVWTTMKARCTNPNLKSFKNYGARGITVCERWRSFENFYADMGDPPKGYTIDRINNDLGYYKENCRWATYKEQAQNQRHHNQYTITN